MAAYMFCVNKNTPNWLYYARSIVESARNHNAPKLRVAAWEHTKCDQSIASQHPKWCLVLAETAEGWKDIGSIQAANSKVKVPNLGIPAIPADDLHPLLIKAGEPMEVFLVGSVILNESGYRALILSDEPTKKFKEWDTTDPNPEPTQTNNGGNNRKGGPKMEPRNVKKHASELAEHEAKAVVHGVKLARDLARLSVPVLRKTRDSSGKFLKGFGEGLGWVGKKLDRSKK